MVKLALYVHLEAKPGKEKDVEAFLLSGLPLVEEEPATVAWFAFEDGALHLRHFRRVCRRSRP